jgi:outer membrane protein OmpA-like peptidoglycan-associated protein
MRRALIFVAVLFFTQWGVTAPSVADQYRDAVTLFRQGHYVKAQEKFTAIKTLQPNYRKTTAYLVRCRERIERAGPTAAYYDRAAEEARELLDLRQSIFSLVQKRYSAVSIQRKEGAVAFSLPSAYLFPGISNDFSASGTAFLGVVKDLALTYRSLYLVILSEEPDSARKEVKRRSERRAVALGSFFFRQGGLPPQNIKIRSRPGKTSAIRLELHTHAPNPGDKEEPIRGAIAEVNDPVIDPDTDWPLIIDLSLLDPARVKSWSLKIIESERGALVREFRGTSDVWVSLQWDGTDERGRGIRSGEYQAFLTATTLNSERLEDSTSFMIRPPKKTHRRAKTTRAIVAEPPAPPLPPQTRKWSHLIRFSFNQADLAGTGGLEVKQLAQSIRAFPDEGVVIEGFADVKEENAESLARRRADKIRALLIEKHGISANRLSVRAKDPRHALEGESLQKSVAFFVEAETAP